MGCEEEGRQREQRKGERGKEEEGRDAVEEEREQVKKDETGWTVVTRSKKHRKRIVQIFVKVDGGKTSAIEMEMSDRVDDIVKKIPISDQDVYVTSGGRILRRRDKLESCEVRDGSTMEVTSRMRGGGRHKDKKSKSEKKQTTNSQRPEQKGDGESRSGEGPELIPMDEVLRRLEESEEYQKNIECMSEGSEGEVQQNVQKYLACIQKVSWMNKEQFEHLEGGVWQAVEGRRKGRDKQQEQRRQAKRGEKTEQEQSKQGKQVRFGDEEQLETRADTAKEPEMMGRSTEVRTGRGSAGLVRGENADETSRKGKGKGNGGKGEHEGRGGGFGHNGKQQETRESEEERVRMAPNMGAGGSHPQATSDLGEGEMAEGNEEKEEILKLLRGWQEKETSPIVRWALADESTEEERNQEEVREESGEEEKKETRGMRWADCEESEGKEKEEQETKEERPEQAESKKEQKQEGERENEAEEKQGQEEEEARQEELTNEKPPG